MEITDAKYQELITDQAKARTLEAENAKLVTAAENTKIALSEGRKTTAELKTQAETLQAELDASNAAKTALEAKVTDVETLKASADKWKEHEDKILADRKTGIDEMKTKLGEDFMKANESFLDGLSDDKVELYLKSHVEAIGGDKKPVIIGTDGKGGIDPKGGAQHTTKFDEAIAKGDANAALAEIPSPFGQN